MKRVKEALTQEKQENLKLRITIKAMKANQSAMNKELANLSVNFYKEVKSRQN